MEEVARQITPLATNVTRMDKTLRSLYRNGGEGAPGYLETAREEDKRIYARMENALDSLGSRMGVVEDYITQRTARENQRDLDALREAKSIATMVEHKNQRMALLVAGFGTILVLLQIGLSIWNHHQEVQGTYSSPPIHSGVQLPQNASE